MNRKLVTFAWHKVCSFKYASRLDICSIKSINKVILLKLAFDFLYNRGEWASVLRARFFVGSSPKTHYISSSVRLGIKSVLSEVDSTLFGYWVMASITFGGINSSQSPLLKL